MTTYADLDDVRCVGCHAPIWRRRCRCVVGAMLPLLSRNARTHAHTHSRAFAQVAIRAVPHRRDFYARLAQGGSHEKFDGELTRWLDALDALVARLRAFLAEGGYGTV